MILEGILEVGMCTFLLQPGQSHLLVSLSEHSFKQMTVVYLHS